MNDDFKIKQSLAIQYYMENDTRKLEFVSIYLSYHYVYENENTQVCAEINNLDYIKVIKMYFIMYIGKRLLTIPTLYIKIMS